MNNCEMDVKQTLKNLHRRFPEMSLDDLFAILDCYSNYEVRWPGYTNSNTISTTPPTNITFYKTNGICESATTGNTK